MSEELLGGNHTAVEPVNQEPSNVEPPIETPATTQDDYFTVKYNHEERRISRDEAPTYIQKGLNYEKVQQRATEYENHLNRVAQVAGYQSHDEMLRAIDEAERQQQEQYYRDRGIDPAAVNQLLEQHPDIQYARQMKQQAEEQQRFQQEANELFAEFPDLKPEQIPAEVWQMKEQKGLSLLDSYLRVNFKSLSQQKEQEAIQKLQQNALSTPGSLGAGAEHKAGYANMSASEKKALREKVLRGELTSF